MCRAYLCLIRQKRTATVFLFQVDCGCFHNITAAGKLFFGLGSFDRALQRKAGIYCGDGDLDRLVSGWRTMKAGLEKKIDTAE